MAPTGEAPGASFAACGSKLEATDDRLPLSTACATSDGMSSLSLARRRALLVACCLLLPLPLAGCGGDKDGAPATDQGAHRSATYNERCTLCGIQWSVKVDEYANGPDTVEVVVENTGERGTLELRFDKLSGIVFGAPQAAAWKEIYPAARAQGVATTRLVDFPGVYRLELRPQSGTTLPFTLRRGATWRGRFDLVPGIPSGTAAIVFFFTDVAHELPAEGLPLVHGWVTWDASRPFIGLEGEVRVTPVASPAR